MPSHTVLPATAYADCAVGFNLHLGIAVPQYLVLQLVGELSALFVVETGVFQKRGIEPFSAFPLYLFVEHDSVYDLGIYDLPSSSISASSRSTASASGMFFSTHSLPR